MPRISKSIIPNVPYLITQRGNQSRDVFYAAIDRIRYLEQLVFYTERYRFDIQAYCLMSNHIHLIGIPRFENSISRMMQVVQSKHTKAINFRMKWTGNLWQQHHSASALDIPHMWNALRYVEQNPVRAGMVKKCEDYRWSSAPYHCGLRDDPLIRHDRAYIEMFDDWFEIVNQMLDDEALEYIRQRSHKGYPCGDAKFVKRLEKKTGLNFSKKRRGRPCNPDK